MSALWKPPLYAVKFITGGWGVKDSGHHEIAEGMTEADAHAFVALASHAALLADVRGVLEDVRHESAFTSARFKRCDALIARIDAAGGEKPAQENREQVGRSEDSAWRYEGLPED